jgi:hypothetical protein
VYGEKSGKKFARQNIIAAWKGNEIVAQMGFKCSCDGEVVETWAREMLIPELSPGDVVVMDNFSRFKSHRTLLELAEK